MTNILKKGILGVGLCFFLAGVASCGPTGGDTTFTYQPYDTAVYGDPSQLDTTVYFWHTLGQNNRAWLETLIVEFNKLYPNIRIQASQQGSYDDIKLKIDRAIAAGGTDLPTIRGLHFLERRHPDGRLRRRSGDRLHPGRRLPR